MNKLVFVTSNTNKFLTLKKKLSGSDILLDQASINLVEPQVATIQEVAKFKAKQALDIIKSPVLVHDSGLIIPALNDFPGPYTKYISETIGNKGILDLLKNQHDRSAYLEQTFCYADNVQTICFSDKVYGHILDTEQKQSNDKKWGQIWNIFAPGNLPYSRSNMSDDEYFSLRPNIQSGSAWDDLCKFLTDTLPL